MCPIPIDNNISESLDSTGASKYTVDYSSWTYVSLGDLDNDPRPFWMKSNLMDSYRHWLALHAGIQGEAWDYRTGDRYARGIYFIEPQAAIAFKLTFQV